VPNTHPGLVGRGKELVFKQNKRNMGKNTNEKGEKTKALDHIYKPLKNLKKGGNPVTHKGK